MTHEQGHWDDEQLLDVVQRASEDGTTPADGHLRSCPDCRARATSLTKLADAGRVVAAESMADVPVPSFERVRSALPGAGAGARAPAQPAKRSLADSVRLVAALVTAQLRLLPGALGPVSAVGFAAAVVLAVLLPRAEAAGRLGEQLFGTLVVLVALVGVLATYTQNRDPRAESLFALPVSPPVVFTCRVVGVLGLNLTMAALCSVVVRFLGGSDNLPALLASWFGQTLLTAGVALVFAVGRSPVLGVLMGGLTWALGSLSGLPAASGLPLHAVLSAVWSTSPAVLAVAVVLLAAAVLRMRIPQPTS